MSNSDELMQDLEELNQLRLLATRPYIKDFLAAEAQKLQSRLGDVTQPILMDIDEAVRPVTVDTTGSVDDFVASSPEIPNASLSAAAAVKADMPATSAAVPPPCTSVPKSTPPRYYKDVTTYAWDQSDKFMKIYVTLNGVQKLSKDCIKTEFTSKSFRLKVDDLSGSNYSCHVAGLWEKIVPDECYFKVKTDTVLVMLKKEEEKKTWAYVTEREDKKKKPWPPESKLDEKKDPSEGLMDLLKKLYDEGDDEMKRTIAKSWTESRSKTSGLDL
jgi:calcyclin binding protein